MATIKTIQARKLAQEILVLGLSKNEKTDKGANLTIHSGDVVLSEYGVTTKQLLLMLLQLGATGNSDEVIKIPTQGLSAGVEPRLLVFTGLGKTSDTFW